MAHSSYHTGGKKEFVGRGRELAILRAAWESAVGGSGRMIAVEGEPGIGKSALVEAFLAEAGETAATAIRVHGIGSDPPVPWGVLEKIIAQLPDVSATDRPLELSPQAQPAIVGDTLAGYLRSGRSLVIVADDAHWADEQSLAVLMDVGRRLRSAPVLLVVAYQATDRPPPTAPFAAAPFPASPFPASPFPASPFPASAGPALGKAWRQMLHSGQADHLPLGGLPPEDILRLAVANGLVGLSPGDAARLHEATGGNPDYLLDLFPLLSSNPIVIGEAPLPVPANRAAGIVGRFSACGPQTRQLLSAAAVLGQQRFSVATLRAISGVGETRPHIQEAVDHALLEVLQGSGRELRFPRRVTGEAIYWATDERVRSRLHKRCADLHGRDALRHRIAAIDGVDNDLAADLRRAADRRMRTHDLGGAAYYLQRAMDCTQPGPARTELLLKTVEALLVVGKHSAVAEYQGELERAPADPWRDYVLGYQLLLAGDTDRATRLLRGALAALEHGEPVPEGAPADLRARIAAQLAVLGVVLLSYPQMLEYGPAAVAAGSDDAAVRGLAWVAQTLGMTLAGDSARALALLADAGEPGSASGIDGLAARGIIRLWTDDLDGAAQDLHALFRRCARGEALRVTQAVGFLGEVEYRSGHLSEAVHFADLAVDNATDNDRYWDYPVLHAIAVFPHAARAEWDTADHHARESEAMAELINAPAFLAYAAGAKAMIAQARDDPEKLLLAADRVEARYDSREPGTHLLGPVRADALARLGRPEEAAEALRKFLDGPGARGRKSARMSVARVSAEIAIARGDYARALWDCQRGRALAVDIGLPLEAARIELTTARSYYGRDDRRLAERALRAAHREFTALGAVAYAQLAERYAGIWDMRLDDVLAALTTRERQVVVLVGKGRTTPQIARDLSVDPKTVESHRLSAYRKLQVRTAAELRRLLGQGNSG